MLTEVETKVLAFARRRFLLAGQREDALRTELGLSSTRYHQMLAAVIDKPEALAAEPVLVKRLLRLRDTRRSARDGARVGSANR